MGQDSLQNAEGHSGTTYMRLVRATIGIAVITWDRAGSSTKGREKRAQRVAAQLEPAQDTPACRGAERRSHSLFIVHCVRHTTLASGVAATPTCFVVCGQRTVSLQPYLTYIIQACPQSGENHAL